MAEENKENNIKSETNINPVEEQPKPKRFDEFLNQQKILIEKLDVITEKFDNSKKKDKWDVLSSMSGLFTFLSSLVIAAVGYYFTNQYKSQDVQISQAQTIEKFIPYLADKDENKKRSALLAIYALQNKEFTTRFAASFASDGNLDVLDFILKESPDGDSKELLTDTLLMAYRNRAWNNRNRDGESNLVTITDYSRILELRSDEYIKKKWGNWMLSNIYAERGDLYRREYEYEQAAKDINKAIELAPDNYHASDYMGNWFAQQKDYINAMNHFNEAIRKDDSCGYCYHDLGNCYKLMGDLENARLKFIKAVEVDPLNDFRYFALGDFYKSQGDNKNAILYYEKVFDITENENSHRNALAKIKLINPIYKKN